MFWDTKEEEEGEDLLEKTIDLFCCWNFVVCDRSSPDMNPSSSSSSSMSVGSPSAGFAVTSSSNNNNFEYKFSPSMGTVIVVVVAVLFFLFVFSIYVRRRVRRAAPAAELEVGNQAAAAAAVAMNRPLTSSSSPTSKGLEKSVVESLPVVHFKDLKNLEMEKKNKQHKKNKNKNFLSSDPLETLEMGLHDHGEEYGGDDDDDDDDGQEHRECAVCLSDFEEEDDLRLLPGCKHVFHKDCIDVWFQSHSTCPLCRASLVPKTSDGTKQVHDDHAGDQAGPHEEAPHPSSTVRLVIEEEEEEEEEQESREEPAATGDLRGALEEQALVHQMVVTIPGDDEEEDSSTREGAAGEQPAVAISLPKFHVCLHCRLGSSFGFAAGFLWFCLWVFLLLGQEQQQQQVLVHCSSSGLVQLHARTRETVLA